MALGITLEDGWPECDLSDCTYATIPGTPLRLPFREGQPYAILQAFMRDLDQYIEPVMNLKGIGDEGSWTENNSVFTSNHKGATAFDYNWSDHPMGNADAGWDGSVLINGSQVPAVRELLAWYEGMVFWGNDWNSPKDSMHFQMGYNTFGVQNVARVQNFIDRKIRVDGYSTWRRGGVSRGGTQVPANPIQPTGGLTADILWDIAGRPDRMPVARYAELLPGLIDCLHACDCNTIDRRGMWFAQVFHESGALFYTREIASGAEYDTRTDLGNTPQVDGDGELYAGRSFIQVTGKNNYAKMSGWAFDRGYVPTRDYFVVHPDRLDDDEFAFLGVTWYWTTQRPLNDAADARNIELATRYVNGGTNGLADRKAIYARAMAHNADLLDPPELDELENDMTQETSRSIYRTSNAKSMTASDAARGADATSHMNWVEQAAIRGEDWALQLVKATALGQGPGATAWWEANADNASPSVDPWAVQHALKVLNYIQAVNPAALQNAIAGKAN